jgi:hypothetical protein
MEVALYAENPSDHAEFMSHFTGLRDYSATSTSINFATRGEIHLYSKPAFAYFYGEQDVSQQIKLAAFTVRVPALEPLIERCVENAIAHEIRNGALVIAPETAYGVGIRFVVAG